MSRMERAPREAEAGESLAGTQQSPPLRGDQAPVHKSAGSPRRKLRTSCVEALAACPSTHPGKQAHGGQVGLRPGGLVTSARAVEEMP